MIMTHEGAEKLLTLVTINYRFFLLVQGVSSSLHQKVEMFGRLSLSRNRGAPWGGRRPDSLNGVCLESHFLLKSPPDHQANFLGVVLTCFNAIFFLWPTKLGEYVWCTVSIRIGDSQIYVWKKLARIPSFAPPESWDLKKVGWILEIQKTDFIFAKKEKVLQATFWRVGGSWFYLWFPENSPKR